MTVHLATVRSVPMECRTRRHSRRRVTLTARVRGNALSYLCYDVGVSDSRAVRFTVNSFTAENGTDLMLDLVKVAGGNKCTTPDLVKVALQHRRSLI